MADGGEHPLVEGCPPEWASEWGEDRYGVFVGFMVEEVEQRLRWIPPGRFRMGSPGGELGRWSSDEGPQHWVRITRGYWLADTPVTQALWEAVLGEKPSGFEGDDRPVERVNWDDGQRFCDALNERIPGLAIGLPTEAQWEYACRAGTTTATYAGDLEGVERAAVLGAIAWYRENSDRQTHPVKLKRPNQWGLYDMLGNVWEWCMDGMRSYGSDVQDPPMAPMLGAVYRVSRGGSWGLTARYVRAAYRYAHHPGERFRSRGLRLVRDQ